MNLCCANTGVRFTASQMRRSNRAIGISLSISGIEPRHDSATGFPVRSHHLSGLRKRTAVKGELLHHCIYYNSPTTIVSTRLVSMHKAPRRNARPSADTSGPIVRPYTGILAALVLFRPLVVAGIGHRNARRSRSAGSGQQEAPHLRREFPALCFLLREANAQYTRQKKIAAPLQSVQSVGIGIAVV